MTILSSVRSLACTALLLCVATAHAQEVNSTWTLHLFDTQHQHKAEATVTFTNDPVKSCMRGKWQRLAVDIKAATDPSFFPLKAALAYKIEHGVLTMARTTDCNPYLLLTGISTSPEMHGTYKAVSLGRSRERGIFLLAPTH